jgi:hypothetical protein
VRAWAGCTYIPGRSFKFFEANLRYSLVFIHTHTTQCRFRLKPPRLSLVVCSWIRVPDTPAVSRIENCGNVSRASLRRRYGFRHASTWKTHSACRRDEANAFKILASQISRCSAIIAKQALSCFP